MTTHHNIDPRSRPGIPSGIAPVRRIRFTEHGAGFRLRDAVRELRARNTASQMNPAPSADQKRVIARIGTAPRLRRAAFTLMETMLALVIIGVGIIAVMQSQREFMYQNLWSTHAATATYLANELREMTRGFPRHDKFSGGIFFTNPADSATFTGWGLETGETTAKDINDLDDLDGAVFGSATTFPAGFVMTKRYGGPINSFGEVIPETLYNGNTETVTINGVTSNVSMRGWTQIVQVTKVDPYNYATSVDKKTQSTGAGGVILRGVEQYPVRVTVTILYQGTWENEAPAVTSMSWIVAP